MFGDRTLKKFLNLWFRLRQWLVMHDLAIAVDSGGMMLGLADINAKKDLRFHRLPSSRTFQYKIRSPTVRAFTSTLHSPIERASISDPNEPDRFRRQHPPYHR